MAVSKRSDQIFQLSLTEIAFTISFILLLLLGYLVMRETDARKKAEEELANVQSLGAATQSLAAATARLKEGLAGAGASNPDKIVSQLVAQASAAAERDRLLMVVKDLEAQLSALAEVKRVLENASEGAAQNLVTERVVAALTVQAEAERALAAADQVLQVTKEAASRRRGSTREEVKRSMEIAAAIDRALRDQNEEALPPGKEAEAVVSVVRNAASARRLEDSGRNLAAVSRENADLRGQMVNMRKRASAAGNGLDHPPCWADQAGNIEYLFSLELRNGSVLVERAWPERRNADAAALPGVFELLASTVSFERFRSVGRPILDISKRQDPECRHFVVIRNSIEGAQEANEARWMVEEFFYKREARR